MTYQKQEETLSPKQKRMLQAARKRYMEDKDNQTIADELGVSHSTVRKYFSSDEINQFKRHFSDQELFQIQQTIERDVADADAEAKSMLSNAQELADSSRAYRQAAKTRMELAEKKVKLLQELGVIDKPKERKEIEDNSGPAEVNLNMELVENEDEVEVKADAED